MIHVVRFEMFAAVAMKYAVFWDVTSCGSCKNRSCYVTYHHYQQGEKISHVVSDLRIRILQFLVTTNIFPRSLIIFSPTLETVSSSKTSVLTRTTQYHIPEFGIIYSSS
jgi:hypothetical protein